MSLQVLGALEGAQMGDELFLVPRREQCRDENDLWNLAVDRRNGGVPRVDEDEIGFDRLADDALEDGRLTMV